MRFRIYSIISHTCSLNITTTRIQNLLSHFLFCNNKMSRHHFGGLNNLHENSDNRIRYCPNAGKVTQTTASRLNYVVLVREYL